MAEKDQVERRVYNLPLDLVERLRAFQVSQNIGSEAEAARRLLDAALQMRDDAIGILKTLKSKFIEEKDLRVLAGDVLAKHALVKAIRISDIDIEFDLSNGEKGRMTRSGETQIQNDFTNEGEWSNFPVLSKRKTHESPSWEPSRTSSDLDDDIPF